MRCAREGSCKLFLSVCCLLFIRVPCNLLSIVAGLHRAGLHLSQYPSHIQTSVSLNLDLRSPTGARAGRFPALNLPRFSGKRNSKVGCSPKSAVGDQSTHCMLPSSALVNDTGATILRTFGASRAHAWVLNQDLLVLRSQRTGERRV